MAIIAPLIAGAAGALGLGAGAASLVGGLLATAVGVGASLIYAASQKKTQTAATISGAEQELTLGGDVPRQIVFNREPVAGQLVEVIAWGPSNSIECEVIALSDWETDGLVGIVVDGEAKTLVPQPTIGSEDQRFFVNDADNGNLDTTDDAKHYGSKLEIRFYRGRPTQVADAELVANSGGRWTTDHRGDGVCYVVVKKTYDADLFSGFPSYTFVTGGAVLYDARQDPSAGGAGTHDWNDPTTWEASGNPAIALYNYQRGFWRDGALFIGVGVPAVDLHLDAYVAAANICDETTETADGVEPRYRASALAVEGTEHRVVMEAFLDAMAGALYEQGGLFMPVAGAARSVAVTLTDDDFLRDEVIKVSHKRTRADLRNYVSGSFTSPDDLWSSKGYTPRSSATDEAMDQGRLAGTVDLPPVQSQWQAERIAEIRRRESRHQVRASGVLGLHRFGLTIGDWVRWNSARHGDRSYCIRGWTLVLSGDRFGVAVALEEVSAAIYSADEPSSPLPVAAIPSAPALTRSVAGFALSPTTVVGPTGEAIPAALATWSPPADATVVAVSIEVRRVGSSAAVAARSDTPETGALTISGLVGGADYEARATVVTDPPRATTWTSWVAFVTEPGSLAAGAVDFAELVPSLAAQVDTLASSVDAIRSAVTRQIVMTSDERYRAWKIGARVKTTVTEQWTAGVSALASRVDSVEAAITNDIAAAITAEATARATEDSALADMITVVEAGLADTDAAVAAEATARATADSALAADITAVEASVGDVSASGLLKITSVAEPSGALSRVEISVRAEAEGDVADAAMIIEAVSSPSGPVSQVKIASDRFILTGTDATSAAPFSVVDGITTVTGILRVTTAIIV